MAHYEKRGEGRWRVRWRDPDGVERSRTVRSVAAARQLVRDVERAVDVGERWEAPAAAPRRRLEDGLVDYLADLRRTRTVETVRNYVTALGQFVDYADAALGRPSVVGDLSKALLSRWHGSLLESGKAASTANLRAIAVMSAWRWLEDSDAWGDATPRARRIDLTPVAWQPVRAPTWAQMDAVIVEAETGDRAPWRARLAVVLRCTGLRLTQAMHLRWADLDLEEAELTIRGELGKSRQEKSGRRIPVSAHLVSEAATWGRREGWLIGPHLAQRDDPSWRMARLWAAAEVDDAVWRRPHHAFRYGFESGLKRLGADNEAVEHLVGHSVKGARAYYLDRGALPLRESVDLVPPIDRTGGGAVVRLDRKGTPP
jgi:integrase